MVYGLLGINWVIVGLVRDEIGAWETLCKRKKFANLIPLTIIGVIRKERNSRPSMGWKGRFINLGMSGFIILVPFSWVMISLG